MKDLASLAPALPTADALDELAKADPVIWTAYYRRLKNNHYTFNIKKLLGPEHVVPTPSREAVRLLVRHRPFLIQPLRDLHPHKVYKKGRQTGVSELSITEVLWFLWSHPDKKWIYTFPRDKQLVDFSVTRLQEALNETPRIKRIIGIPNQIYTKRIGQSFMLLRSAWESNLGEGIDADGVTFDEKDRMKEGIEVAFRESLSSSPWGLLREVSTPTLPGRGVDAPYATSCQFEWHVKCTKCGLEQTVDHPDNIIQMRDIPVGTTHLEEGTYEYRCRKTKCRGTLDRTVGRWIPAYPLKTGCHGYWIPQTICPWINATQLMQKKIEYKFKQLFDNYCLGRTSIGENVLLTEQDFEYSCAGHEMLASRTPDWSKITVGIDWGHLNWVVVRGLNAVNNKQYVLAVGVFEDSQSGDLESVKAIEAFIAPFDFDILVADAGYGKDRNSYLLKKFPGKVYSCWYNPSDKNSRTFKAVWSDDGSRVLVDRTMTLKNLCRSYKEREVGLPRFDQRMSLFMRHFLNLAPLKVEEDGEIYETIESTGDDHLAHADNYAAIAMEKAIGGTSTFQWDFV